ncbi:MAG: Type 1 glutamine amidotransferase-like domain-containing protein [Planctomycetota bacterium]
MTDQTMPGSSGGVLRCGAASALLCGLLGAAGPGTQASAQSYDYYLTGSASNVTPDTLGGVLLAGGGSDSNSAMARFNQWANGGDVVVIRASGSDGYNDYLFSDVGGTQPNSVETIVFNRSSASSNAFVLNVLANADAIFIAGGDQDDYYDLWQGTAVETTLNAHIAAGKPIGGTSAGLAILGSSGFSAANGTVFSDEMLDDPFNQFATLDHDFLETPFLDGVITDSHFVERNREGRLAGFLARSMFDQGLDTFRGVGVEEASAIAIEPTGLGRVYGPSNAEAWFLQATEPASQIVPGQPLVIDNIQAVQVTRGGFFDFNTWTGLTNTSEEGWSTANGNLIVGPPVVLPPDLPGDANGDGLVDLLDFDVLAQHFGSNTGAGPAEGDFNADGVVDLLDFDVLAQHFGSSAPGAVPEPASLAVLGLGGAASMARRRERVTAG